MGICKPFGLLAYNPRDLVPDGFVDPILLVEYPEGVSPTDNDLQNPRPGQSFSQTDDGIWIEKRRQLPANRLSIEIRFRTTQKSSNESVLSAHGGELSGLGVLGGGAGVVGLQIANNIFLGGITAGSTEFTFHLCESTTILNKRVEITDEIIQTGQIDMGDYVMSVLSVTDYSLMLTAVQERFLGLKTPRTSYPGIAGSTNGLTGQFDGNIFDSSKPDVYYDGLEESNRFLTIVRDKRLFKFRADNKTSRSYQYAFESDPDIFNDLTTSIIQIETGQIGSDYPVLKVGDPVFVTFVAVNKRVLRQLVKHKGTLFTGGGPATIELLNIGATVIAWNFAMAKWMMPEDPNDDKVFLLTAFPSKENPPIGEQVEGWRISEVIDNNQKQMFVGDQRGIGLFDINSKIFTLLMARQDINDQAWFDTYLKDSRLANRNISELDDSTGSLFDISEHNNSVLFDQEKIPYFRPFALAIADVSKPSSDSPNTTGIGISNLDLVINGIPGLSSFDLSSAEFEPSGMSSVFPSAYGGEACSTARSVGGVVNYELAAFYEPSDPLNATMNPGSLIPAKFGDIQIDWKLSTPFFLGRFGRKTRIFIERYTSDSLDFRTRSNSAIFVRTFSIDESPLAIDYNKDIDRTYLVFSDANTTNISYHVFEDLIVRESLPLLGMDQNATHEKSDFTHNKFRVIGYDRLIGDMPSYSSGKKIVDDLFSVCFGGISWSSVYEEVELFPSTNATLSPDGSLEMITNNERFGRIRIEYKIKSGSRLKKFLNDNNGSLPSSVSESFKSNVGINDTFISLYFVNNDQVIDNIALSPEKESLTIDGTLYSGSPLRIQGDILSQVEITKVKADVTTSEKISKYIVNGRQLAMCIDANDTIFIFFFDEERDNISVAFSGAQGDLWYVNRDIIRLVKGELADLPYVMMNSSRDRIYLFYRLNGSFLMYKFIDPSWIECEDKDVIYERPEAFGKDSPDDLGLENYTSFGKDIRQETSYFVCGDKSDLFFTAEMEIAEARNQSNSLLTIRFSSTSDEDTFDQSFANASYAVYRSQSGNNRLIYSVDGKIYIKKSNNLTTWIYEATNVTLHKNFLTDNLETEDLSVENIQIIYNKERDLIYLLYFYRNALYLRMFYDNMLFDTSSSVKSFPDIPGEGFSWFSTESMKEYMTITSAFDEVSPFFLVGQMDQNVLDAIKKNDSDVVIRLMYPTGVIDQFVSANFAIDETSKPVGYFTAAGSCRIFYRTSDGDICGITFAGLSSIILDCQLIYKN